MPRIDRRESASHTRSLADREDRSKRKMIRAGAAERLMHTGWARTNARRNSTERFARNHPRVNSSAFAGMSSRRIRTNSRWGDIHSSKQGRKAPNRSQRKTDPSGTNPHRLRRIFKTGFNGRCCLPLLSASQQNLPVRRSSQKTGRRESNRRCPGNYDRSHGATAVCLRKKSTLHRNATAFGVPPPPVNDQISVRSTSTALGVLHCTCA